MPPRPATRRHASPVRQSILVALVAALAITLPGLVGGGPRVVLAADPTPGESAPTPSEPVTPSEAPTPSAAPSSPPSDPPTPSPAATPTPIPTPTPGLTVLGASVTFFGRGYGHGVGLSQYGARGRAVAGEDAATILAHYYRGTTLGSVSAASRIRVLVLSRWRASSAVPLVVYGRLGGWAIDGIAATFPVNARLRVSPTTTTSSTGTRTRWRIRITSSSGSILYDGAKPATLVVRATAGNGRLQLWSKSSAYDQYRGALRIITSATVPTVTVVNELPLEQYLRGVVSAEMPYTWPAAALEAQAVAARSYAARRLRPGVSYYDVPDDSSSQVYRGVLGERASTNSILAAHPGVVLRSGSSIANTLFHSTGGGATENNENVYVSATGAKVAGVVSYLRGSGDRAPDGTAYDAAAPYATWATRTYTRVQLSAWFAADPRTNVGTLTALDLRVRGVSGRLISVTLVGSAGTRKVSGDVFRAVFNAGRPPGDPMLRSTLFGTAPIP
jgi:stage II sporulation protein D